ncbi:hypothetical protein REPUB_Repub16aG0137600 [Reevesia pubescens]
MNFAKNTVCLKCDAKRPKGRLLPGEWECPECNFLNYRRNMACFHCDCKRPPDAFMESKIQEMQPGPRTRFEKVPLRPEVPNASNFDFDDDESDGADVAAFEAGPASRVHERKYSEIDSSTHGNGFDDFDDFDDIDSYEIDSKRRNPRQKASSNIYSDNEAFSEPEGSEGSNDSSLARLRTRVPSYDEELSVHPNWKSSHVADSKHRGRDARGVSKNLSFVSEDLDLDSDGDDDFDSCGSKRRKENKQNYGRGNFQRGGRSDFQGGSFSSSDYENGGPH